MTGLQSRALEEGEIDLSKRDHEDAGFEAYDGHRSGESIRHDRDEGEAL